ncbi:MAG: Fic family protein [Bacteroidota bacterium]
MARYIYERKEWPTFKWDLKTLESSLAGIRYRQGRLLGRLETLGFPLQDEATLETLTQDVIKSSEIEGEKLPADQVRSSIAKRLGIEMAGEIIVNRNVEGVVEMMLDATQNYNKELSNERLFGWHSALFITGRNGITKIKTGGWRNDAKGPMHVVSGPIGKERIHYEAPRALLIKGEMSKFIDWFNRNKKIDPVLKAAIAHLWFVTIHPFHDGNGRIARAIADMQLARADESRQRFYSMSAQIQRDRNSYYAILERTQKGDLDITEWLLWFFECLDRAISISNEHLSDVLYKAKFWETHQVSLNERQRKIINKLLDKFDGKLTSTKYAKLTKSSPDTALRDIQDLINKQILQKEEGGGRSTSYKITDYK